VVLSTGDLLNSLELRRESVHRPRDQDARKGV